MNLVILLSVLSPFTCKADSSSNRSGYMQIRGVRTEGFYQTGSLKVSNILAVYITVWLFPLQNAVESELVPLRKITRK